MDPARLKADASAALAAGQFARAGSLYAAYCATAPRDRQSHLRMGDAWARAGDTPRAIDAYLAASQGFAEDGFLARAIAASKLVVELDPKHTQMQRILADLYARRAAGGQTLRAMLAGATASGLTPARSEFEARGASFPRPESASTGGARPPVLTTLSGPLAQPALESAGLEPLAPESPAVLVPGLEPAPKPPAAARPAAPELVDLVVTEYLLEPDPSERTLEDVLSGEAERDHPPPATPVQSSPLELDAPALPPAEEGPRFLELTLDDAPVATDDAAPDVGGSKSRAPAAEAGPVELPVLTMDSVLLPDEAGAAELGPAQEVASPESPGDPPYVDLFAEDTEEAVPRQDAEDTGVDDPRGPLGQLAGPDEELPPGAGPLLLALEELSEHPPLEASAAHSPFVAPAARSVPRAPLFSDLSPDAFVELVERCPLRRFRGGERIVQQGDPGASFFVICEGRVSVLREENGLARPVAALEAGEFFGEVALLAGGPRIASVDALADDTQVLEIPAGLLLGLARRHPGVASALKTFCRQRLLTNLLATSPLFRPLDRAERRELAARFRARDALPEETVVSEGAAADGLYVILAGEVEVLREEAEVSRLGTGDVFGEMSLLDDVPANATVRALRRTSLLRLPILDLANVLERYPAVRQHLRALRDARAEINDRLPLAPGDEPMLVV